MRKKMKAAWFLAALLSAGLAAFPAMAAQGWAQENSSWVYYDSNGNKVYNEWKKGADGQWRYLNGEGYMGYVNGSYMLFASEEDYWEYMEDGSEI